MAKLKELNFCFVSRRLPKSRVMNLNKQDIRIGVLGQVETLRIYGLSYTRDNICRKTELVEVRETTHS